MRHNLEIEIDNITVSSWSCAAGAGVGFTYKCSLTCTANVNQGCGVVWPSEMIILALPVGYQEAQLDPWWM